nr:hypothetical protein [Tanacetum cinerariifolium]
METVINLGNHSLDRKKFSSFFYEFKNNKKKSFVLPDGVGRVMQRTKEVIDLDQEIQIVGEPDCLMMKCVCVQDVNYVNRIVPPLGKPRERYNVISKLTEHIVQTGLKKLLASDIVRK